MARAAGKKQAKPGPSSTSPQTTAGAVTPSIPAPFVIAPAQLRPFAATLPTTHVYAVHIDSNPTLLKRRVFNVPILLNIVIVILLGVRAYYAAPVYLDQIITIFGYETAWKVKPETMTYTDIFETIASRTGLLIMDYAIFGFIGSWPWEFVFGSKYIRHTGPLHWRRSVGFQDTEIIVRKGRHWDNKLFKPANKVWSREDELEIQFKVEPAMRRSYTSKTGYQLLDRNWDLDFKGMVDAHRLTEKGRLDIKDLDHIVLVYYQKQWLLWRVHEATDSIISNTKGDETITKFRSTLKELGHEDLFFRWIEIMQYETSLPGGFTQARRTKALADLKELVQQRKINYDKLLGEIGGESNIPGINQAG